MIIEGDVDAVRGLRGSIYRVLLVSGWFSVQKPLSQIQRSTLSPFQQTFNSHSFGGFGLREWSSGLDNDNSQIRVDGSIFDRAELNPMLAAGWKYRISESETVVLGTIGEAGSTTLLWRRVGRLWTTRHGKMSGTL